MKADSNSKSTQVEFVTQDPNVLSLLQMVGRIAATPVTALIQGESGTGKELIAKRIHALSPRRAQPMVSINCGALQDNLLLSELFGHEKGAFTGAIYQKRGLVEVANGGTLFLDEIGEMGLEAQAKLLRFLQEGEIYRVGGKLPIRVDVRIVSATNRNLESLVKEKRFREDLFYRVNTVTLQVPPLRKRRVDIPLLFSKFLRNGTSHTVRSVTPEAMAILQNYPWPGNIRELINTVERFKILVDNECITEADIPFNIRSSNPLEDSFDGPASLLLAQVERRHIFRVLSHFGGNKTKAAHAMGITVKTLYNKLARYQEKPAPSSAQGISP